MGWVISNVCSQFTRNLCFLYWVELLWNWEIENWTLTLIPTVTLCVIEVLIFSPIPASTKKINLKLMPQQVPLSSSVTTEEMRREVENDSSVR